jgi:hypothetical protein
MNARHLTSAVALAVGLLALAGCGRSNPVLGDWEIDRQENDRGVLLAVQAAELEKLSLDRGGATSGETRIPGEWVVEEGRVRLVREDERGEHLIEVLPDDRIRVELPIGVTAVYRRVGAS